MPEPLTWFRLYSEAVDDEKLRLLAFEDRWHFVALLCCKAKGILDGEDADMRWRKVGVKLGLDPRELAEVARRLAAVGLIDETTLSPLAWNHRQFKSDSSLERVRKYRDKMKRYGNVSVTSQETETETETETEKRKRVGTSVRASRLTLDACPADWVAWCKAKRTDLDPAETWERFSDYWRSVPGAKGRKLDWQATWRNWVRNEREGKRKSSPADVAALVAELEARGA